VSGPLPISNVEELAAHLAKAGLQVTEASPGEGVDAIDIYLQPSHGAPAIQAGPIAVLYRLDDQIMLWVADSTSFGEHPAAWDNFVQECSWYFDPNASAQQNWAYATYHLGTVVNFYSPTAWVARGSASRV